MRGTRSIRTCTARPNSSGTIPPTLGDVDAVILPGGFSYGDYLRCGAIARFSPVMKAVKKFAADGGLVLGVCNGFQILVEAGLLPGALLRNPDLKFICREVHAAHRNHGLAFHFETLHKGPDPPPADRARRRPLFRRRAHARRTRSRRPHGVPLRRQSERFDARHRRHSESRDAT